MKFYLKTFCILFLAFKMPLIASRDNFGLKGGMNFSYLKYLINDNDKTDDSDIRASFRAGLFSVYNASRNFAMQIELLYAMKGTEIERSSGRLEIDLGYIEVPLLARFNFNFNRHMDIHFHGGGFAAFNVLATSEYKNSLWDSKKNLEDNINNWDAGVIFGGGIRFTSFGVDISYHLGLMNILDEDYSKNFDIELFNRELSLMLSYYLN